VKRAERVTADQLSQIYVKARRTNSYHSPRLPRCRRPRNLVAQQISAAERCQNSGRDPPNVPLDQALTFLEDQAKQVLPQGFTVDYAGESRQLRVEGSKFLGTFLLSAVLIYLVLAGAVESFRDPFIILAGSSARDLGALTSAPRAPDRSGPPRAGTCPGTCSPHTQLAGLSRVVDREALRQNLLRLVFQEVSA